MIKQLGICLLLSLGMLVIPRYALAQEAEILVPADQPVVDQSADITTRETLEQAIAELRTQYRGQLEEYRTAERQAEIANGQYSQLGTLVALETAVSTTRRAMLARATVLETFLTILNLQMADATGINLEDKTRSITRLEAAIAEVSLHKTQVESAADRTDLARLTEEFEVLAPQIEESAYEAQSFLAIGKLQTVYDKTVALGEDVRAGAGETTQLKQAERDRAYTEIQTTLDGVAASIDEATPVADQRQRFNRSQFSTVLRDLGSVYTGLSQTLSFIEEYSRL